MKLTGKEIEIAFAIRDKSKKQVSAELGVKASQLSRWIKNGIASPSVGERLLSALELHADDIVRMRSLFHVEHKKDC